MWEKNMLQSRGTVWSMGLHANEVNWRVIIQWSLLMHWRTLSSLTGIRHHKRQLTFKSCWKAVQHSVWGQRNGWSSFCHSGGVVASIGAAFSHHVNCQIVSELDLVVVDLNHPNFECHVTMCWNVHRFNKFKTIYNDHKVMEWMCIDLKILQLFQNRCWMLGFKCLGHNPKQISTCNHKQQNVCIKEKSVI